MGKLHLGAAGGWRESLCAALGVVGQAGAVSVGTATAPSQLR